MYFLRIHILVFSIIFLQNAYAQVEGRVETNYWNGNAVLRMSDGTTYIIGKPAMNDTLIRHFNELSSHEMIIKFFDVRAEKLAELGVNLHVQSLQKREVISILKAADMELWKAPRTVISTTASEIFICYELFL